MIKYYCDICGKDITPENQSSGDRLIGSKKGGHGTMRFEIITGLNAGSNNGCFCKYCIIDAVNHLDDRPQAG